MQVSEGGRSWLSCWTQLPGEPPTHEGDEFGFSAVLHLIAEPLATHPAPGEASPLAHRTVCLTRDSSDSL